MALEVLMRLERPRKGSSTNFSRLAEMRWAYVFRLRELAPIFEDERRWGLRLIWGGIALLVAMVHASVIFALCRPPKPLASVDQPPPTAVLMDLEPSTPTKPADVSQEARSKTLSKHAATQVAEQLATYSDPVQTGASRKIQAEASLEQLPENVAAVHLIAPAKKIKKQGSSAKKQAALKTGSVTPAKSKAPPPPMPPLTQPSRDAARTPSETAGSAPAAVAIPSSWRMQLLAHLNRFKRYPEEAKARHLQGTALLSFHLDREGRVLNFFLARSSGDSTLDAESLAMIERASPLPPPPPEVDDANLHLLVPIQFSLM